MRTIKQVARVGLGALALASACAHDPTAPAANAPEPAAARAELYQGTTAVPFPNTSLVVDLGNASAVARSGYMVTSGRHKTR